MPPERDIYTRIQEQNEESQDIAVNLIVQDECEGSQETIIFEKNNDTYPNEYKNFSEKELTELGRS